MISGQPTTERRCLAIVADDFGCSSSVNRAVAIACDSGFITAASLVAGGDAFEESIRIVSKYPMLSVGLHITLSDGSPVLPPGDIPDLVNGDGRFEKSPMRAGVAYWRLRRRLSGQIEAEVRAQFDKLERAGIRPTHVDCHHHLHIHPVLFPIIARETARRDVAWIRIPREPLSVALGLHMPFFNRRAFLRWFVFRALTNRNLGEARSYGLRAADHVYGLSSTGRVNEKYLLALLPHLRDEISEIYLHPDLSSASGREETKAVTSRRVFNRLNALGLQLAGFEELTWPLCQPGKDSVTHADR